MPKIGFLFLTQREFTQPLLWKKYFENQDNSKYDIVIHSKPNFEHQIFTDKQIIPVETNWHGFGLIEAQHLLLLKALQDNDISHFIFISETTIPIQSFDNFFEHTSNIGDYSIFDSCKATAQYHLSRIETINNIYNWTSDMWYLNPQWVLFSREHAKQITENFNTIKTIFENSIHSSEHAYSNFLINNNLLHQNNYINKNLTHVDWDGLNDTYPSSYYKKDLTNDFIKKLTNNDLFFLRKVFETEPLDSSRFICSMTNYLLGF
jgi:hypothetical protein